MAGPPTSSFVQLNWNFSGTALAYPAAVTMGFTAPSSDPQEAVDEIATIAQEIHEDISTTTCTLDEIVMKAGPSESGPTYTAAVNAPGAVSNDSCGPAVALLVRKVPTNISGRFAGRFYYPGVPATWVDESGGLTETGLSVTQNAWLGFLAQLNFSFNMDPMIFRSGSSDPRAVGSFQVQGQVGTQRRRNRR